MREVMKPMLADIPGHDGTSIEIVAGVVRYKHEGEKRSIILD